jgi:hypothetical protein
MPDTAEEITPLSDEVTQETLPSYTQHDCLKIDRFSTGPATASRL